MIDYREEVIDGLNERIIGINVGNIRNKEDEHA